MIFSSLSFKNFDVCSVFFLLVSYSTGTNAAALAGFDYFVNVQYLLFDIKCEK